MVSENHWIPVPAAPSSGKIFEEEKFRVIVWDNGDRWISWADGHNRSLGILHDDGTWFRLAPDGRELKAPYNVPELEIVETLLRFSKDLAKPPGVADAEEEPPPHALEIVPAALDLEVVPPDCPDPKFPVNARAMHTYMQVGKDFSNWIKDRIGKFQFVKDVDFGVFAKSGENPQGGRPAVEYWLTQTTARIMAADVNSERGREVIKFLVARHERLEALDKVGQPAALNFGDPVEAARLFIAAEEGRRREQSLRLEAEADAAHQRTQVLVAGKIAGKAVKDMLVTEELNQDLERQRAREERAIPLSEWLSHTTSDHGHGLIIGRKVMYALGLLKYHTVAGCDNTEEAVASAEMIKKGVLFMSSSGWLKTKINPEDPEGPADGSRRSGKERS